MKKVSVGPKKVPFLVTSDGRTLRYPDPLVKVNDSILYDLEKGKMKDFIKFESGENILLYSFCYISLWELFNKMWSWPKTNPSVCHVY